MIYTHSPATLVLNGILVIVAQVPGVFISRLVRGGLAESTGLLGVNDEIVEVNGIDVGGKSLDQVNAGFI